MIVASNRFRRSRQHDVKGVESVVGTGLPLSKHLIRIVVIIEQVSCHFGRHENVRTEHEAVRSGECRFLSGELHPDRPNQRSASASVLAEQVVHDVYQAVPKEYCLSDNGLYLLAVLPRLSPLVVEVAVCSEERVEDAELVCGNCNIVTWLSIKARDVSTHEAKTSQTTCKHHLEVVIDLTHLSLIVPRPECPKLLTAYEM